MSAALEMITVMITVTKAVQEKMFVVFRSSFADAHETRTLKFVSKFMLATVTDSSNWFHLLRQF